MSTSTTPSPWAHVTPGNLLPGLATLAALGIGSLLAWPRLARAIFASDFLPHAYCYLKEPALVWTHVISDSTIGIAYLAISINLAYLVYRGRRDLPFHWMVLAFGLFIVACGLTHFVEALTVWVPVYVLSAILKVFTALISLITAIALPFTVSPLLTMIHRARDCEEHEREVARAEAKFRGLLEAAPDAVAVTNPEGEIVLVNHQVERLFGYRREELLGHPIEILLPQHPPGVHSAHRSQFFASPQSQPLGASLELLGVHKNGSEFPVEVSLSPLQTKTGLLVSSAIRDVSERKREQEALKQSEERFRRLVEDVRDYAIFSLDPQGNITSWNLGAERMKGYQAEEIIGRHFSCFYPEDDLRQGKPAQELRTAIAEGRVEDEGWRVRKDGSKFWANVVITALRDSGGNLKGFSKLSRDITVRKRIQDQLEALNQDMVRRNAELLAMNKELESFSYSVSHDLRSPLRHIAGFSQLLLEEHSAELSFEAQRYLQRIREGTSRMGQLIDELLGLARLGRQELKVQVTSLKPLVEEVLRDVIQEKPGHPIDWIIHPLPYLDCDPLLMKQALTNLLSNAVKFTSQQDHPIIEIGSMPGNPQPVIFVRDNGVGFSMKYADKLFGVFQRLHRPEDFPGTGVGLATVQRIIQRHGGRVWAEAELGRGATFYFTLGRENGTPNADALTSHIPVSDELEAARGTTAG
ncbi:MAG: PAS domain S-box protein [Terriglobales bacterium]|jgi:PAS domain S-box-containing protein